MNNALIERISFIDTRVREDELRIELYATMIPLILSREIFKKNRDITEFTDKLILKKPLRNYVFRTRTQIVARLSREIQEYNKETLSITARIMKDFIIDFSTNNGSYNSNDKRTEKIVDTINKYSRNKTLKVHKKHD